MHCRDKRYLAGLQCAVVLSDLKLLAMGSMIGRAVGSDREFYNVLAKPLVYIRTAM